MKKILFLLAFAAMFFDLSAQTEVQITDSNYGASGAGAGDIPTVAATPNLGHTHITRAALATSLAGSMNTGGDLSGPVSNAQIVANAVGTNEIASAAVTMAKIAQAGAATGQTIKWNGTAWAPANDNGDTYTAGAGISITGSTVANTGDLSTTNELQTLSIATNTVTLSNSGGSFSVAGAGIASASTTGSTITITATEADGSPTNELQTVARTANTNDVVLSNSGGTVKVNDRWEYRTITYTAGQTTATIGGGALPANLSDIFVKKGGLEYIVGAPGCSACNVTLSGSTLTFPSTLLPNEPITCRIAIQ